MFWGLVLEPGKRYAKTVDNAFHISAAVLDTENCDDNIVRVLVEVDQTETVLCNLSLKHGILQVPLDLQFIEGDRIAFYTSGGKASVHLSGYIVPEEDLVDMEEGCQEEDEGETSEEESLEEIPQIVAANGLKRKIEAEETSEKKKIKAENGVLNVTEKPVLVIKQGKTGEGAPVKQITPVKMEEFDMDSEDDDSDMGEEEEGEEEEEVEEEVEEEEGEEEDDDDEDDDDDDDDDDTSSVSSKDNEEAGNKNASMQIPAATKTPQKMKSPNKVEYQKTPGTQVKSPVQGQKTTPEEVKAASPVVNTPGKQAKLKEKAQNQGKTPGKEGKTPGKQKPQSKEGGTPGKEVKTPGKEGNVQGKESKTPAKELQAPPKEGKTPNEKGKTPGKEGKTPGKEGKTPGKEKKMPKQIVNGTPAKDVAKEKQTPKKETPPGLGNTQEKAGQTPGKSPGKMVKAGGVVCIEKSTGSGAEAKSGKMVSVYYEGRLKNNNKMFDKTWGGAPFRFRLGSGEVIKGWDVGVSGMKVGGVREITCPPHMAYGKRGAPPDIPPGATLVFKVQLKGIH